MRKAKTVLCSSVDTAIILEYSTTGVLKLDKDIAPSAPVQDYTCSPRQVKPLKIQFSIFLNFSPLYLHILL